MWGPRKSYAVNVKMKQRKCEQLKKDTDKETRNYGKEELMHCNEEDK